jgi:hypothetical protein
MLFVLQHGPYKQQRNRTRTSSIIYMPKAINNVQRRSNKVGPFPVWKTIYIICKQSTEILCLINDVLKKMLNGRLTTIDTRQQQLDLQSSTVPDLDKERS